MDFCLECWCFVILQAIQAMINSGMDSVSVQYLVIMKLKVAVFHSINFEGTMHLNARIVEVGCYTYYLYWNSHWLCVITWQQVCFV